MTARRILHVLPNSRKGGAERLTSLFLRSHDRKSWEPEAVFFDDGPLVAEFRGAGIPCHVLHSPRPRLRSPLSVARTVQELISLIKARRVDLVHSVMGYGHLFGGPAALAARVPEVWFQHGPTGAMDWATGRVPTRTLFVNSRHTLEAQARYHAWAGRVVVLHPAVESLPASPDPALVDSGRTTFGLIGRISPMKGHDLLLEAVSELTAEERAKLRFLVVGGPFMPGDEEWLRSLKKEIKERGLDEQFVFTGHLDSPWGAMSACDVILNASKITEPFGLTLIEAMKLGKPVIAPSAGGPLEIVSESSDGLLFKPGNSHDLVEKIRVLGQSKGLRQRLGENAKRKADSRFGVARMIGELEAEYERIFEGR